ncbi:hypothetical protein [Chamaesiphon sp.]
MGGWVDGGWWMVDGWMMGGMDAKLMVGAICELFLPLILLNV